jgi:hypothetical protein
MQKPFINIADAPTQSEERGERFGYSMADLTRDVGAKMIGVVGRAARKSPQE